MTKIERWKPEDNQKYYFVSNMLEVIENNYVEDCEVDRLRYKNGNCFKTKAEAQTAAKKVKALLLSLHDNGETLQAGIPDNQLPKLTAEVFDRPDCPVWAKYAAVDAACLAHWYQYPPIADERVGAWTYLNNKRKLIDQYFNRSDWQNSLVERPVKENKLPDWCKPGEWVWLDPEKILGSTGYKKVKSIEGLGLNFTDGVCVYFSDRIKQARLRPYNKEELRSLVGKVIEVEPGQFSLCLRVTGYWADFLDDCAEEDDRARIISYNNDMLKRAKTIDGTPCGVLEHLEDGEWVE